MWGGWEVKIEEWSLKIGDIVAAKSSTTRRKRMKDAPGSARLVGAKGCGRG
jgi:hypothetical protein